MSATTRPRSKNQLRIRRQLLHLLCCNRIELVSIAPPFCACSLLHTTAVSFQTSSRLRTDSPAAACHLASSNEVSCIGRETVEQRCVRAARSSEQYVGACASEQ